MKTRKSDQPYRGQAKNLNLLFGDDEAPSSSQSLPLEKISISSNQPRRYFDPEKMEQLTQSIREHGILEPLLVRPLLEGGYELVAGERRYRAAGVAGLAEVPVVIRDLTDDEAIQIALVENLQREGLNPVEETEGILQLLAINLKCPVSEVPSLLYRMQNESKGKVTDNVVGNSVGQTIEQVFKSLGLMSWESFIHHRLPLLNLPTDVLDALRQGKLAYTKAKAIARLKDEQQRQELLEEAITNNFSLSQIKEKLNTNSSTLDAPNSLKIRLRDAYMRFQKAKLWDDPRKQKKIEKVLVQLEALLGED